MARTGYEALREVQSKELDVNGYTFRVQFNPARIRSSAANVDAKAIQERPASFVSKTCLPSRRRFHSAKATASW
jgi:hypothetical protein